MTNKLTNILLATILAIGVGILIVSLRPGVTPNFTVVPPEVNVTPTFGGENEFYDGVSATVISVSATSTTGATTQVSAANSGAQYRRLQNTGNYMLSCQLDDATSTLAMGTGIILYSSSTVNSIYEITPNNLYKGIIRCISQTSTGTISVVEK